MKRIVYLSNVLHVFFENEILRDLKPLNLNLNFYAIAKFIDNLNRL